MATLRAAARPPAYFRIAFYILLAAVAFTAAACFDSRPATAAIGGTASTSLSSAQVDAIAKSVDGAVASVGARSCIDMTAKQAQLANAIANVTEEMIYTYGASAAGVITSVVIAETGKRRCPADKPPTLLADGGCCIPDSVVAQGLGQAAAAIYAANPAAANAIALAIANEGTRDMVTQFALSVSSNGGPSILGQTASEPPQTTTSISAGQIPGTFTNDTNNVTNNGGQAKAPCLNPSCT